jgi:amino acid adenylation domain-containing protein
MSSTTLSQKIEDLYPMSDIEKGIVFHSMTEQGLYHNQDIFQIKDTDFQFERLMKAAALMAKKHTILRTTFKLHDFDEPIQLVHKELKMEITFDDISGKTKEQQQEYVKEQLKKDREDPFDFQSERPLWRMKTIALGNQWFIHIWISHHSIVDGWSIASLKTELYNTYNRLKTQPDFVPEKLKSSYKNFVIEQITKKKSSETADFWKNELEDYKRPQYFEPKHQGNKRKEIKSFKREIEQERVQGLKRRAKQTGTNIKNLCLAAYLYVINIFNYDNDVVTGLVTANRPNCPDGEKIIGCFANTIPIRLRIPGKISAIDYVKRVEQQVLRIKPHEKLSLYEIARVIEEPKKHENPVFNTVFNFIDFHVYHRMNADSDDITTAMAKEGGIGKLAVEAHGNINILFNFTVDVTGGGMKLNIAYADSIMEENEVKRLSDYWIRLLDGYIEDPRGILTKDRLVTAEEKKTLLYELNDTEAEYPEKDTIHQVFERQVVKYPGKVAAVIDHQHITYKELDERSSRLAANLRQRGIEPDKIVAVQLHRSLEIIVAMLGILKAGGAYLPIDPEYPQERIDYMLKDSNAVEYLTSPALEKNGGSGTTQFIPEPRCRHYSSQLCYIIYTSGTTGKPKGVMLEHRNVIRLLFNTRFQFNFNEKDVWTMFHSPCFDFSVWEMYGALLFGGELVIIHRRQARDPGEFLRLLKKHHATVLNQTPSAFYNLIDEESLEEKKQLNLKYVIFGGEALSPMRLKNWEKRYPETKLINMFGITETTVHVTYREITKSDIQQNISNIGKPIPTLKTYILAKDKSLLPPGVDGELHVGGEGVARGYLNKPELTALKFTDNPYKSGDRLYSAGDRARYTISGDMEYLGRIDNQVQLRGFRIELGEIESRLKGHEEIKNAVVLARKDDDNETYLTAYTVAKGDVSPAELRKYLMLSLPDYMIPKYIIQLPKMPLTHNGKVNKKELPEPEIIARECNYKEPKNEFETGMVEIWKNALKLEKIGINDNFFNIGGDSIKAIKVVNMVNKELNINLEIAELYEYETIEKIAAKHEGKQETDKQKQYQTISEEIEAQKQNILSKLQNTNIDIDNIDDIYPMSDIEKGMILAYMMTPGEAVYHDQFVYQVNYENFEPERFQQAIDMMEQKHSILRTNYSIDEHEQDMLYIYKKVDSNYRHEDISGKEKREQEDYLRNYLSSERARTFVISSKTRTPLWRLNTFQLTPHTIALVFQCHHAILDGWSVASLTTELNNTYLNLKRNQSTTAEFLKSCHRDYIIDQINEKRKPAARDFWKKELDQYTRLKIFDFARTSNRNGNQNDNQNDNQNGDQNSRGKGTFSYSMETTILTKLERYARANNVGIKNICFAAYMYMISMISYDNDIVAGLVTNNRPTREDGDKILGCFLNTIPVRMQVPSAIKWTEFIKQVTKKIAALTKYDRLSLFEIARTIGEKTDERTPLFSTIFNFIDFHIYGQAENTTDNSSQNDILEVDDHIRNDAFLGFSISITFGLLKVLIKYDPVSLSEETINRIAGYYNKILNQILRDADEEISKERILGETEKRQVVEFLNDTATPFPEQHTLHRLFEEQAKKTPQRTAIIHETGLNEIVEELKTEKVSEHLMPQYIGSCFKKNPHIVQLDIGTFFKTENGSHQEFHKLKEPMHMDQFLLLRTHQSNYTVINRNLYELLNIFDGETNLQSISRALEESAQVQKSTFIVYDPFTGEEASYRQISQFNDTLELVKTLYRMNLVDLTDIKQNRKKIDVKYIPFNAPDVNAETTTTNIETQNNPVEETPGQINASKSPVLLLGDTPGTAGTGLLYLASYLRRRGIEAYCQWNNNNRKNAQLKNEIQILLQKVKPAIVGISMKWFPHIARVLETAQTVKDYNPDIQVIIGGDTASHYWKQLIQYEQIDIIVKGDGEEPLFRICRGDENIPNTIVKKNGKVHENPQTYIQDGTNTSEVYLSHIDQICINNENTNYSRGSFYINTGKGCSFQCFYCGGCRDAQFEKFGRKKPFLRGIEEVRKDLREAYPYTTTFMFDFDLPLYDSIDYYRNIWQGFDFSNRFCEFYFWELPGPQFIEIVSNTFKYVYLNIDLNSLSEPHREKLSAKGLVKPQPTDRQLLDCFDICEKYENIEVKINLIDGLPFFTTDDIKRSHRFLDRLIDNYTVFKGLDWGRLHAQPGAPLLTTCENYDMYSYAKTFEEFLHHSQLNMEEENYPDLAAINYPFIYSNDSKLNSEISKSYFETTRKLAPLEERKKTKLSQTRNISYEELNKRANRLALRLEEAGVKTGDIVGLIQETTIEMAIGILAIMKTGAAYLPLDPANPLNRLEYMVKDSGIKMLLTDDMNPADSLAQQTGVERMNIQEQNNYTVPTNDHHRGEKAAHTDTAYVIYTSGTTGKPKGTAIRHQAIVNTLTARKLEYKTTADDVSLQLFSYAFDGFLTSFFTPLLSGSTVVLPGKEKQKDITELKKIIQNHKVTHFISVPSLFQTLLENAAEDELESLNVVTLAGDRLTPNIIQLAKQKCKHLEVSHEYGVTEAAVMSTILRHQEKNNTINIGKPVSNTMIKIINRHGEIQQAGVPGELCIGGTGLAIGYLNRPELTNEKFIDDTDGKQLYKTSDMARWLQDGNIEFLGRIDHQVKIRGYRIELAEIEDRLLKHQKINEAVVIDRENEDGEKYLCAYQTADEEIPVHQIKKWLSNHLPEYMIPAAFVYLEKIPLTPTGKIDRKALPAPEMKSSVQYVAPNTGMEKAIADVWKKVLKKEKIGVNDNFFDIGGNSLNMMKVKNELKEIIGTDFPVVTLFTYTTVSSMARFLKQENRGPELPEREEKRAQTRTKGKNKLKSIKQKRRNR